MGELLSYFITISSAIVLFLLLPLLKRARRLKKEVFAAASGSRKVLAILKKRSEMMGVWKQTAQNQQAVFISTKEVDYPSTIAVFDYAGCFLAELFVPRSFERFEVTEEALVLHGAGRKSVFPLEEIQWYTDGKPFQLPKEKHPAAELTEKWYGIVMQTDAAKKTLYMQGGIRYFAGYFLIILLCITGILRILMLFLP